MENIFKKGDIVQLIPDAKFISGKPIGKSAINSKIYIREVKEDNKEYVISTFPRGAILGTVSFNMVEEYEEEREPEFVRYTVKITIDDLTVRAKPGVQYKALGSLKKNTFYTITEEKNGYGRLINNMGWIDLDCTKKI